MIGIKYNFNIFLGTCTYLNIWDVVVNIWGVVVNIWGVVVNIWGCGIT